MRIIKESIHFQQDSFIILSITHTTQKQLYLKVILMILKIVWINLLSLINNFWKLTLVWIIPLMDWATLKTKWDSYRTKLKNGMNNQDKVVWLTAIHLMLCLFAFRWKKTSVRAWNGTKTWYKSILWMNTCISVLQTSIIKWKCLKNLRILIGKL